MQMELSAAERDLLASVLEARLGEYSEQIASADDSVFRERLREEREMLQGVLARLRAA